jgi:hypothetical protein
MEAQRAMAAAEVRPAAEVQPTVPVVMALPATSAVESRPAPAAAEARLEAAVTAPRKAPATAEARPEAVEGGEAQARSSLASRLRALGGHVSRRMRHALHLGIQKAPSVVRSHYEVNFEAVASSYVVLEGVEDEAAMEQADALAADAAEALTESFTEFLFPDVADADELQP